MAGYKDNVFTIDRQSKSNNPMEYDVYQKLTALFKRGLHKPYHEKPKQLDAKPSTKHYEILDNQFEKATYDYYSKITQIDPDRMRAFEDFEAMEYDTIIATALDIYADESTTISEEETMLKVTSDNEKIEKILTTLFDDILMINSNLWIWARQLCKYGNHYLLLDVDDKKGIVGAMSLPVREIERQEAYDGNLNSLKFLWQSQTQTFDQWQIAHFRIMANQQHIPYGTSMLDSARRIWKQLQLAEDAMIIYRITRAPQRRIFYIDVGNLDTKDVGAYIEKVKNTIKKAPLVDQRTGNLTFKFNPLPIHKDSIVPLLDGRNITIEQVANEYAQGKTNYTYSIKDTDSSIVPGKIVWAGKNYTAKKLIKVTLDDDSYVITAPEHPFILRDGSSIEADKLVVGTSLMPLYTKNKKLYKGNEYETIYNPVANKYEFTHTIIAKELGKSGNTITHHIDHNRFNNSPENLDFSMTWQEHFEYHAKLITILNKSEEHRKVVSDTNRKYKKAQHMGAMYNGSELHKEHNKNRAVAMTVAWNTNKDIYSENMKIKYTPELVSLGLEILEKNNLTVNDSMNKIGLLLKSTPTWVSKYLETNTRTIMSPRGIGRKIREYGSIKNHKIKNIEIVTDPTDVYCMTIEGLNGEQDRHNFAIVGFNATSKNGTFVRNSVDEDYFLPTRGGNTGTKIDTLEGAQNMDQIADVEYLRDRMFAALKIPKSFLSYESDVNAKATLSSEDYRFSRTINRIQQSIINELTKIARIQLYTLGYRDIDQLTGFKLELTNPSTQYELDKLGIWATKAQTFAQLWNPMGISPVSLIWGLRNIMKFNDEEIKDILKQQFIEGKIARNIMATMGMDPAAGAAPQQPQMVDASQPQIVDPSQGQVMDPTQSAVPQQQSPMENKIPNSKLGLTEDIINELLKTTKTKKKPKNIVVEKNRLLSLETENMLSEINEHYKK